MTHSNTAQHRRKEVHAPRYCPVDKKWVEDPEKFDVWVGEDSNPTLHGEFKVNP